MNSDDIKLLTNGEDSQVNSINFGIHFCTNMSFSSKEDLIAWARNTTKKLGFVLIILRADNVTARAKPRVILGCDRAGSPADCENTKGYVKRNIRKSSSKRCGCKFAIKGFRENDNEWKIEVQYGFHNHEFVHLEAHAYIGRLDGSEQMMVAEMFNAGVKPRKILSLLKNRNLENTTTVRTIYNEKAKLYRAQLDGGTPIQYLFKCINDSGYTSFTQVHKESNRLESIFFAHPTSVRLSNMFPNIFLLDCTYKTNRYRMPLLSIVGVTSTRQSFFSSFAFIGNETEASYTWALECFKFIFDENVMPNVFVTDREIALMNAIKIVFPQTKKLLCQFHIYRNILAHCKKYFKLGKECDMYLGVWQDMINSPSENDFYIRYNEMLNGYGTKYPQVISYVTTTWIEPYKELFISAWIDRYMHLGNTTTNRVEGGHNQLKKFLEVSIGNLSSVWTAFDQMINLQHKGRPKRSMNSVANDYKSTKREPSLFEHVLAHEKQQLKIKLVNATQKVRNTRSGFSENVRSQLPIYMRAHFVDAIDVMGDGHCGYRVISMALDMGDNWMQVRNDLLNEMHKKDLLYTEIFGATRKMELQKALDCWAVPAPVENWMTLPDMGLLVTSYYNIQLVYISRQQSFTFLPLYSAPPALRKTVYMGYINENHFIFLRMKEDCTMPPIFPVWTRYHELEAE